MMSVPLVRHTNIHHYDLQASGGLEIFAIVHKMIKRMYGNGTDCEKLKGACDLENMQTKCFLFFKVNLGRTEFIYYRRMLMKCYVLQTTQTFCY